ncbi:MAG: hypothetical protein CL472_07955 [Acidobacteria bacterium]|nr:hypothetical protein [Acidobacteriota bacterium]
MTDKIAPIGHNNPPLEDRIFQEEGATIATVLAAVEARILREHEDAISEIEARAKTLSANAKRLPEKLDEAGLDKALDLLAEIGNHSGKASDEKTEITSDAKSTLDALTKRCKNLETGISALEKKLRPMIEEALIDQLQAENDQLPEGEKPHDSYTYRAQSGAKASISMNKAPSITDENLIPREYLVPDMKSIEKDFAAGKDIPGIVSIDKAALRLYKNG